MKRTHELPLVAGMAAGVAVGLGGVVMGVLLAHREGQAMRHLIQQATRSFVASKLRISDARRRRQDSGLHVQRLAQQARQAGEQVAKVAGEQHEQYLPKAKQALSGAFAYAGLNGKPAGSPD